uniref:Uncharacterized protein LOC114334594 isoform X1 n=1 Tax=Diabrotica virgifera virgifera TaxID=50390 RepID=A0A6P7G6H2_DIAVI
MGQKPSRQQGQSINKKLPFALFSHKNETTQNINPQQPIRFQYKTKRKNNIKDLNCIKQNHVNIDNVHLNNFVKPNQSKETNCEVQCKLVKTQSTPVRTKSEPNLVPERTRYRNRRKKVKNDWNNETPQFGYEIQDVDAFLNKATIEKPANIPVVLAFPSVLYQTRVGGYQAEISLPLGMVVNAVFKNQHWLYVQTPHAEEGYVSYAACLPLGKCVFNAEIINSIIPPPEDDKLAPCWEKSTDVFPKPSGNLTDTEKLSSKSDCEGGGGSIRCRTRSRNAVSTCGEKSIDRLYLRAAANAKTKGVRHTLLVIVTDFSGSGDNNIAVQKGDVVFLVDASVKGWFYVKSKEGGEGYIPAAVAGHGFL